MYRMRISIGILFWLVAALGFSQAASSDNDRPSAHRANPYANAAARARPTVPIDDRRDSSASIVDASRTCTYQGGPKSGSWACR